MIGLILKPLAVHLRCFPDMSNLSVCPGQNCEIRESVIGRNCVIGDNVEIVGSYIEDNCIVETNAKLDYALLCENAVVCAGATVNRGCILSFNVVISQQYVVPPFTRVSLCRQSTKQVSTANSVLS